MTSVYAPPRGDRHYFGIMALCLAGLVALALAPFLLPNPDWGFFAGEAGPIQVFSSAAYLTLLVALWRELGGAFMRRHIYLAILPIALCLRELDFHNRFTTMSITKTSFYLSAEVPLWEKALAVLVFGLLVWACCELLIRYGRAFLDGLRAGKAYAVAICLSGVLGVVSKAIDGIARKLAPFGIQVPGNIEDVSILAEEVMELGIPLFLLLAVFALVPRDARTGALRT